MLTDSDQTLQQWALNLKCFILNTLFQTILHKSFSNLPSKQTFFTKSFQQHKRAHFSIIQNRRFLKQNAQNIMNQENRIFFINNLLLTNSEQGFNPFTLHTFIRNHKQLWDEREQIHRQNIE